MTRFYVDIVHVTPEIHRILEQLRAHPGVKIDLRLLSGGGADGQLRT